MTEKKDIFDSFAAVYDESIPCDDDDSVLIKDDRVDCESLAPRRLQVKIIGRGNTKSEAENDMHDELLDAAIDDRARNNIKCSSGKCKKGRCHTTYEIDDRFVKCRKAKRRGGKRIWICTYAGNMTHYCICVPVA